MDYSATTRSEGHSRAGSKISLIGLLLARGVLACPAWAAMVTTQEANLDTLIFDLHNFGSDTIDLRFNQVETLVNADLLAIGYVRRV
jgi:hypothetical protein